jgi:hypothetical protein
MCQETVVVRGFEVDKCIASIVESLPTVSSCCGHGKRTGRIVLEDGRELEIHPFSKERAYRYWSDLVSVSQIETM